MVAGSQVNTVPVNRARARWYMLLRLALGLGLLVIVGWNVPWRDRLLVTEQGTTTAVAGEIQGSWQATSIGFTVDPAVNRSTLPARLQSDLAALGNEQAPTVQCTRRAADSGADGYEWRPGIVRVFAEAEGRTFVLAFGLLLLAIFIGVVRWWRLLAAVGVRAPLWDCTRLTFLGVFFNLVVPGLTGGDVVKAVLVVRENPTKRADAFVSVVVDRALGLFVIVGLTAVAVSWAPETFGDLRAWVVGVFLTLCVAAWAALAAWPRKLLRVDAWLPRLPQGDKLQSLDRAVREYLKHPTTLVIAVLLSIANHVVIALALWALTITLGAATLQYMEVLAAGAIANVVSSVPLAPGGWGVGEAVYGFVYQKLGEPGTAASVGTVGIAVSVSYRLLMTAMGLIGGLFLLTRSTRAATAAARHES